MPMTPTRWQALGYALVSPAAVVRLRGPSTSYLLLYLSLAAGLLGTMGWLFHAYQDQLRALIYGYLFPRDWGDSVAFLVDRFLANQQRIVVINAITTTSLLAVSACLFVVKEWLSAAFERDAALTQEPAHEHPLWRQAWQELQYALVFVAAQGAIFLIGYPPHAALNLVAIILGYVFLYFTFAVDFIAPILQRRRAYYWQIWRLLCAHPLATLSFGAIFSLPSMAVGVIWQKYPDWPMTTAIAVLFSVQIIAIAWAAVAGTYLGSKLLPQLATTPRAKPATSVTLALFLAVLLVAEGYVYGALALSVHHKSQILKCHYSVDLSSIQIERPSWDMWKRQLGDHFDRLAARTPEDGDDFAVGVSFVVEIENPTAFDVHVEHSEIEIRHRDSELARARIDPIHVAAGTRGRRRVDLALQLNMDDVAWDRDLFAIEAWRITLYVDVAPHLRMPVYLLHPEN